MKKIILLLITCMASLSIMLAQNYVTLTFTAKLQDNTWIALDSVKIINLNRSWSETLYHSDTTLQMTNSVNIEESETQSFKVFQNIPNPFKGTTNIRVQLPSDETVSLKMYDLNGKECASYSSALESGLHDFTVSGTAVQMYVLQVKTSLESQSLQILSIEPGKTYGIKHSSFSPSEQQVRQKVITANTFISNDSMQFIGYCTYNGNVKTNTILSAQTGSNTTHTFTIPMGYAVGDVYYNANGIAEGIVCWLADTVITYRGIAYGDHGKMVSLDEKDKAMYSTNNSSYPTRAYDSLDGRVNTAIHIAITLDSNYMFPERLEGSIWCTSKGEGWYFPAKCELYALYDIVNILNTSLQSIGSIPFTTTHSDGDLYWSSTEKVQEGSEQCTAFARYFDHGLKPNLPVYTQIRVRAMKWF